MQATGVAELPDGKVIVAGTSSAWGGRMFVARLRTDGAIDRDFDSDGFNYANFTPNFDGAGDVAIQSDGRIVVAGFSHGLQRIALARFEVDGDLDPTFGVNGLRSTDFVTGVESAREMALLDDDSIVLAGMAANQVALMRFTADGAVDTTFSGDGLVRTDVSPSWDEGTSLDVAPDGSMVVAGVSGPNGNTRVPVVRYEPDGDLDTTFSDDGKHLINFTAGYDDGSAVAILDDGGVLVAGEADARVGLARFLSTGAPDPAFSGDGIQILNLPGPYEFATELVVMDDGRTLLAGHVGGSGGRMLAARIDTAGALDPTFSGDGWVGVNFTTGWDNAWDIALLADGRVLLAGSSSDLHRAALSRLQAG